MTDLNHPLVVDYLHRLETAAAAVPADRRADLVAEIRDHLGEALRRPEVAEGGDAAVRTILDRLGSPEDIVAAESGTATPQAPAAPGGWGGEPAWRGPAARTWGPLEIIAVLGLTVGVVVLPVIGPLGGMVCAWASTQWTRREKVVATVWASLPALVLAIGLLGLLSVRVESGSASSLVLP